MNLYFIEKKIIKKEINARRLSDWRQQHFPANRAARCQLCRHKRVVAQTPFLPYSPLPGSADVRPEPSQQRSGCSGVYSAGEKRIRRFEYLDKNKNLYFFGLTIFNSDRDIGRSEKLTPCLTIWDTI